MRIYYILVNNFYNLKYDLKSRQVIKKGITTTKN